MGSRSEVVRLVGEVTDRYGSLDAFFARLRAEFDDQPTTQLPVLDPAAGEPKAWSRIPAGDRVAVPVTEVEATAQESDERHDDRNVNGENRNDENTGDGAEYAVAPQRPGMWGRLTGRMR